MIGVILEVIQWFMLAYIFWAIFSISVALEELIKKYLDDDKSNKMD